MQLQDNRTDEQLIERADVLHRAISAHERELFQVIATMDRRELWRDSGAWGMAHWVSMRYGISHWKARRWIAAAHTLEGLPLLAEAFSSGELGTDKVVELTRFATPETEGRVIVWARRVSSTAVRQEADLAVKRSIEEAREAEEVRALHWWYFKENSRFGLHAELPAAQGAVVAKALSRVAEQLPIMPGEDDPYYADARRADALVAVCSARIAEDADPDRATVVVHARMDGLASNTDGSEVEGGPVIHPEIVRRLLCNARVQTVVEDEVGRVLGVGRVSREPPPWMMRALRYRDRECTFPGCGARRFVHAHHITWWRHGGRTTLENLTLTCAFHHKLVHEFGWSVRRAADGTTRWSRPDGTPYRAGPGPPPEASEVQPVLLAV
jgi:Domain of unknown function (DUF222)/HNH endonuclease